MTLRVTWDDKCLQRGHAAFCVRKRSFSLFDTDIVGLVTNYLKGVGRVQNEGMFNYRENQKSTGKTGRRREGMGKLPAYGSGAR